ncbi:hypothetical protein CCM_04396 [Cordyceps militaris CM01]|uniref:Uncharacterized protein n=1 Tax=Cordyceps militaris (strain CM01) TaxID=983644 RepID=G3JER5_CORMM|nr:uncharacterized protein CCM_04396 [Cordyceps militaris CM01]EGX93024.1 hypothetical protein CCM_04396 [Cordyceps militaris CM01]
MSPRMEWRKGGQKIPVLNELERALHLLREGENLAASSFRNAGVDMITRGAEIQKFLSLVGPMVKPADIRQDSIELGAEGAWFPPSRPLT